MPDDKIRKIVQQEMQRSQQKDQYGVNRTPVHTHNGLDSPKIDFGSGITSRQVLLTSHVPGTSAASSGNYGHFFYNPFNYDITNNFVSATSNGMTVLTIVEIHGRAGNDASPVTLALRLLSPGDASLTGGSTITTFDLKGTADTPQYRTLITGRPPAIVYPGQRLALQTSGTLTNVADVLVTVLLQY